MKIKLPPRPQFEPESDWELEHSSAIRAGRWWPAPLANFTPEHFNQLLASSGRIKFERTDLLSIVKDSAWGEVKLHFLEPPFGDFALLGHGLLDRRTMELCDAITGLSEHPELWQSRFGQFMGKRLAELGQGDSERRNVIDGLVREFKGPASSGTQTPTGPDPA